MIKKGNNKIYSTGIRTRDMLPYSQTPYLFNL